MEEICRTCKMVNLFRKPEEKRHFRGLGICGRTILKWTLREFGLKCGLDSTGAG
jgi:hypothetical protein